MQIKIRKVQTA